MSGRDERTVPPDPPPCRRLTPAPVLRLRPRLRSRLRLRVVVLVVLVVTVVVVVVCATTTPVQTLMSLIAPATLEPPWHTEDEEDEEEREEREEREEGRPCSPPKDGLELRAFRVKRASSSSPCSVERLGRVEERDRPLCPPPCVRRPVLVLRVRRRTDVFTADVFTAEVFTDGGMFTDGGVFIDLFMDMPLPEMAGNAVEPASPVAPPFAFAAAFAAAFATVAAWAAA